MVELSVSNRAAVFTWNDVAIGTYVLDDPFKPYLHPLRTPAGHVVSLAMPHDHRHHKGLMYALATEDVNFWEEVGDEDHPRIGRQVQEGIDFDLSPEWPGIRQRLLWLDDRGEAVFAESRAISCLIVDDDVVRWSWSTRLEAQRDTRLRISQWAQPDGEGRLINYHGLGMRFARSIGLHADHLRVFTDDGVTTIEDVHGATVPSIGLTAAIDGFWEAPHIRVSMRQLTTNDGFFLLSHDFTTISVGPSVLGPVDLPRGATLLADYEIEVSDLHED